MNEPTNLKSTELAFVIAAKNYEPSLLNPSLLKYSGILPTNWELARQPIVNNQFAQIVYQNGVSLIAQPGRVTFLEAVAEGEKNPTSRTATLVCSYIESLPNLDYQGVGINLRSFRLTGTVSPNDYLRSELLVSQPWHQLGSEPLKVSLNLQFNFDDRRLNLSVGEAQLQMPEAEQISVVLFTGNFDYSLSEGAMVEKRQQLAEIVGRWPEDLATYTEVVEKILTPNVETIMPIA